MRFSSEILCSFLLLGLTTAVSTFSPARPPAIPLAVRSPYLNTWLEAGSNGANGGHLAGEWPTFWFGQVTGWAGMIKVDNETFTWLGAPGPQTVTQTAFVYTSTRSTFTMNVGGFVEMNITFLSPVTPTDFKRQSLIFSYLEVTVSTLDGKPHAVQLYADTSAEWCAGDHNSVAQWEYGVTGEVAYHRFYRQTPLMFSQTNEQADWGNWYWSTKNVAGLTYQSGSDDTVRGAFELNGKLANTKDTNFRAINNNFPVFGYAVDLGTIGKSASGIGAVDLVSTVFTLGLTQKMAAQFVGQTMTEVQVPSLWTSYFDTELAAVSFFYNDYSIAAGLATKFDSKVASDSLSAGGQDYVTITSLAARQAFGTVQLMGNSTKQYLFLKEISSDGNMQTVDVIFPFHPILLYTNPTLLKLTLDPLFENQETGDYPNSYSMHDLGTSYPNATGHPAGNDEKQPLEECGNMLIMTLAYAQRAKDTAYLTQHYSILKQWTGYLVDEALIPANQISTDDFAGSLANQTNLALKGIIGIEAMATIANLTGHTADAQNYTSIAHSYITQWQNLAINKNTTLPHTTLAYGMANTHGLLYNLYGDTELGLNLVPQSVYDMQSAFYPTVALEYGVPLDTRNNYTKSDWEMFAAAIASTSTKELFISKLATWIGQTTTAFPETDLFDCNTGGWPSGLQFTARPVVGGHFALLALSG
ncbi:glutaminase GtaA [Coleophoma cylindrospora]|uniref:Glutaminase GtaA n=1 Tax=Coleophoma cylindrospora TaxID=1849047 RepID=A0A3D8S8V4_9HELO|nr:glutaminase GtaA [Coleophoma cylindrospora]